MERHLRPSRKLARRQPRQSTDNEARETTDGFHLVIDALKLNGIDTIYGLPGIPITDLTRMAQAKACA
jgi:oxalyl-CoA decarboxylase